VRVQPLLLPQFPNVRRRDPLIVAVVPFSNVLGDFDLGFALQAFTERLAVCFPWQLILVGEIEQLQGTLGPAPWRYIAVIQSMISSSGSARSASHPAIRPMPPETKGQPLSEV